MLFYSKFHQCFCQGFFISLIAIVSVATWRVGFADERVVSGDKQAVREISVSYCEFHTTHRFAVEVVREAYNRIGVLAKFAARPCRRSLIEANSGRYGAEVARIPNATIGYTNLIPVEAPTIEIEGVVITKNIERDISQWSDLKGLRLGIIRGELYAEIGTAAFNVNTVNSYSQLLRMLARDRFDAAVVIRRDFLLMIKSPEFWNEDIHIIGKPVFSTHLYHLVHMKNQDLLPKLNPVFIDMWRNGDTDAIHKKTFKSLISQ